MKTKCWECEKDFVDPLYEKFGEPIRIWCNDCLDKKIKELGESFKNGK